MREQTCEQCGKHFGRNELVSVFGTVLCRPCAEDKLEQADKSQINEQTVFALSDPTICARCGADNGSVEFERFLEMPICPGCNDMMVNYRYPIWVKAFFAGILIITAFSIVWNLRFFQARVLLDQSIKSAFIDRDIETASNKMLRASSLVPESHELRVFSHYFQGIRAVQADDSQAAVNHFQQCTELPEDYQVQYYLLAAQIGTAFDNQDYQKFLQLAQELRNRNPEDPTCEAQVASAYACLYAVDGDEAYKQKAMEHLQQAEAKTTADGRDQFNEYRERIMYRLETRKVLSREEYYQETGKTPPEISE